MHVLAPWQPCLRLEALCITSHKDTVNRLSLLFISNDEDFPSAFAFIVRFIDVLFCIVSHTQFWCGVSYGTQTLKSSNIASYNLPSLELGVNSII